jgi:hypothetical protein
VPQFEFLGVLWGRPRRTSRVEVFCFAQGQEPLTAKFAKENRKGRKGIQIEALPRHERASLSCGKLLVLTNF